MKKSTRFTLLSLLVLSLSMLMTPRASAWRLDSSGGRADPLAVDAAGDVIVAGRLFYGGDVFKLSGTTGQVIWQYNASHNLSEQSVAALALDSNGDVFVAFDTRRGVTKLSGATGARIWEKPIGGSIAACQSRINAITVDRDDNVVTVGTAGCLFNVAKLDGRTGDEKWHYEREGYGKAVAVDPFGDVAAAGVMNRNFAAVKLRGKNGEQIWQKEINGVGNYTDVNEEANAVAMDKDGSVVVAGATNNQAANFRDFTVVKYLPDGRLHWKEIVDGQFDLLSGNGTLVRQSNDTANAVAIDKDGDVIAAGSMQEGIDIPASPRAPEHFHVIKITRDGGVVWSKKAEDPPLNEDDIPGHAFALSINAFGNVVVAGVHNGRFTLVKFWGRTGGRAWRRQLASGTDSTLGGYNQALRVVMDAASDVVAAGETPGLNDGLSQFTVVKLRRVDGLDYDADPTPTAPETVVKYAPLVYLHSDEKYRPSSPITFINNSSLGWFREGGCKPDPVADLYTVEPQRLGTPNEATVVAYSNNPGVPTLNASDCSHIPQPTFTTRDFTRPYDEGRSSYNAFWKDNAYYEREGFYLDLDDGDQQDELRGGIQSGHAIFPGAPVFYEYVPRKYVTYWFFYPYDDFSEGPVPVQHHEGDWERISIQLDAADSPVNVFYYAHEDGETAPWEKIEKYEVTHPVVYSAKGSHASYRKEGKQEKLQCILTLCAHDSTDRGPRWLTWKNLQNVTIQSWYGFGGAWGQVDAFNTPVGSFEGTNFTGPLGPSSFKNSRDKWSPRIIGRVTGVDGNGLASVRIRAFDTQGNLEEEVTTCNGNPECGGVGYYSLDNLVFGKSYTLVPSKTGYAFTPVVRVFTDLREPHPANFAVADTIAPRLSLPANITVNADIPQGATVYYTVIATDNATQSPRVACSSQSGSLFPIGTTTVACTATDDAGNSANGTFKIIVKGAAAQLTDFTTLVKDFKLPNGIENSLVIKLQSALTEAKEGHACAASNKLKAFMNEVQAQYGKKISPTQANQMLATADRIRTVMGC